MIEDTLHVQFLAAQPGRKLLVYPDMSLNLITVKNGLIIARQEAPIPHTYHLSMYRLGVCIDLVHPIHEFLRLHENILEPAYKLLSGLSNHISRSQLRMQQGAKLRIGV